MNSITYIFILALYFFPLLLSAQSNYFFERVIAKDQPFEIKIYALHSDDQNFLWIGSDFGLYRYDGVEIKDFNHILNKNMTGKTPVSCFYEGDGVMLVGTLGEGLIKYDRNSAAVKKMILPPKNKTPENFIRCLKASNHSVFIGTNNGIFVYDKENDTISKRLPLQPVEGIGLEKNQINSIEIGPENLLWIGSMGGLHCYNPVTGTYESFNHILPSNTKSVWSLKISGDTLWVATNNGLVEFHLLDEKSKHHTFKSEKNKSWQINSLLSICDNSQGSLWLGTYGGGVILFNKKDNSYSVHSFNHSDPHSISSDYIFPIIRSYDQTIWIGTENGLNKFSDIKQKIKTLFSRDLFYKDKDEKLSVVANGNSGSILLGTKRGRLYRLQNDLNKITLVASFENTNKPDEFIESLYEDRESNIWIGTTYGLQKVDKKTRSLSTALTINATVSQIIEDQENTLWLSTGIGSGVARYKPKTGSLNFIDEPDSTRKLTYYNSQLFRSSDGCIWISGLYNLTKFNPSTNSYSHFKQMEFINSVVAEDRSRNVWIGNYYGWFYKFNSVGTLLDSLKISTQYETPTNLLIDDLNYLWVSTPHALLRIHPDTHEQRVFTANSGMRVTDFSIYYAAIKTDNNQLLFGSENGLIIVEPKQFITTGKPSPVFITNFELLNSGQNHPIQGEGEYAGEITLNYNEANFKISFAVLDLIAPERNEYKYRLEGISNEWILSGTNNTVTYNNLNPGTYNFRVLGSNHSGTWNEEGTSIKITILPPPWRTWWAYSLYAVAFISLLVIGRNEIIKRERLTGKVKLKELEAEKYQELDNIKSRFFANISHEFRTPLTLLLGPIEKRLAASDEAEEKTELSMMHRNASRLLTLVNQLLDLSRLEAGTLKLQCRLGSLNDFINSISSQFSSMAASKQIDFAISASKDISLYFDHDKLEKIITNLLSNAYKFTPSGGSITLTIDEYAPTKNFRQGFAEIAVWDTGKGIEREHLSKIFDRFFQADTSSTRGYEGAGIGLSLTKELVDLHGGIISVTSIKNEGSCFAVKLPLGYAHLKPEELMASVEETVTMKISSTETKALAPLTEETSILPNILIVEDNADLRTYLRNSFNGIYAIIEATDGEQGLAKACNEIPDLVISCKIRCN